MKKRKEKEMDETRRKLVVAADEEIKRVCAGDTEYLAWLLQKASEAPSVFEIFSKLVEEVKTQGRHATLDEMTAMGILTWLAKSAVQLCGVISEAELEVPRIGAALPTAILEKRLAFFVSAHRDAFAMWQHREELELMCRTAPPRPN